MKGNFVASKMTRRVIALSAFAAAVAGPVIAATAISASEPQNQASPGECLAWFGNRDDGKCLSYSNGTPINAGTPDVGIYGPNGNGIGVSTGPLIPGGPPSISPWVNAFFGRRRRLIRLEHGRLGVDRRERHHLGVR